MAELSINQQMADLIGKINAASEAYYGGREELMSNYEWDALFDALIRLEKKLATPFPIRQPNVSAHRHRKPAAKKSRTNIRCCHWRKPKPLPTW
ncbi:hypothetical protein ACRQ5I_08090 [Pseudoramibacter alactolyticus]|uniref:hypothetical protein n=1 Tax=Pseudoramibacter alactolyticus TaxID=113287 RepID=UPI003D7F23AA